MTPLPNNKLIWNFKGKHKTLNAIYDSLKNIRHKYSCKHEKISYKYFDSVLEHAVLGKITLSMFTYNIVSYINRIKHEPQTLGELFRDLECELETLAISMQLFIQILTKISEIQNVVKDNKDYHCNCFGFIHSKIIGIQQ